ncbi:hypothetical protein WSM22_22710 [Cytophagales bacterium WSM2-2]|nr:hypothetical protein WSM22_22710 [Cytophagales bacterium WSM2-2]
MKLGVHITFFFVEGRLKYLYEVLDALQELPVDLKIFIYSNRNLDEYLGGRKNIEVKVFNYWKRGKAKLTAFFDNPVLKWFVHPYHLTWEHRKVARENADIFDVQMYLEDDMKFDLACWNYWLKYQPVCTTAGYNLGFIRVEKDDKNIFFCTDIVVRPTEIVELEGHKFLLNNSSQYSTYCAFWIYDKQTMQKFVESDEWRYKFSGFGIREKSAIGWHGLKMNAFKGTLIPVVEIKESYQVVPDSSIHHLPNNYIGDQINCQIRFPFSIDRSGSRT